MIKRVGAIVATVIMLLSFVVIIVNIAPTVEGPAILEVDDSGGKPYTSIQAAVDDAQPGDTVYVYAGTYYEDVVINITINLTGEDRDTTIINSTNLMGIYVTNANFVNISGFTVENGSWAGIRLMSSNNSLIYNNRIKSNEYGIQLIRSNNTIIKDNIVLSSFSVGIEIYKSSNNYIHNNTSSNKGHGIRLFTDSKNNTVSRNQVISNMRGIILTVRSNENIIRDNIIVTNTQYGIVISNSNENLFINNSFLNNQVGIKLSSTNGTNIFINDTIISSISNDVEAGFDSNDIFLNTTFNKSKSYFYDSISIIKVQWYLHVNVTDFLGNPIADVNVKIEDNKNGTFSQTYITDTKGFVRFITVTEYIEQDTTGDSEGEKIYYTPHKIIAWNDTLVGYAYPNPIIDESKTINIILYIGTLLNLESGWNLISLPRPQVDTNLQIILQSLEGRYDTIWWYNSTDSNDNWKLYNIYKPSFMNDLENLNHTMGFWIHVTDLGGTTLVVFGDVLTSDQHILLYPGWNLVGFPSKTNKTRDIALGTLTFGTDVDSIWMYNSSIKKWIKLNDESDYFEVGQGYWVHSKVEDVWNVPL